MPPKKAKTYGDEDEEPEVLYHESSDEDFNPDSAPADDAPSSSEDEDAAPSQRKGKRKAPVDDELDSGDEVTIAAAKKAKTKKRKKGSKDEEEDLVISEDEGGEGGLIKTRAQRAVEKEERKPLARTEGATVDVEALWAQMIAAPLQPVQPATLQEGQQPQDAAPVVAFTADAPVEEELVAVTKTYTFAGQNTTEEKQIPRSALEKYTSEGWKPTSAVKPTEHGTADPSAKKASQTRRPQKRPTRFDPNPTGYVRALAPEHQLTWPRKTTAPLAPPAGSLLDGPKKPEKATKLNVVDKSRMDWTGFVDKEGIAEELQEHGKTKDNYLGRMDFLAGVEQRREEEGRKGRVAGAVGTS
ncbi:swr complex subunit [Neodidymelliopsis sp. IMI 364377]|nr:swr complex subunit [Neodidymelliopsis sp. IMI 364377]